MTSVCFVALYSAVSANELERSVVSTSVKSEPGDRLSRRELRAELKAIRAQLDRIEKLLAQQSLRAEPAPTIVEESQFPNPDCAQSLE